MKYLTQLFCGIVLSSAFIAAAISAEVTAASSVEGTVVSSLNTDSYTYVEITKDGQKSWIVGPLVAVKPGNQVKFEEGTIMADFYSKQLNRTFPRVMFVQEVTVMAQTQ